MSKKVLFIVSNAHAIGPHNRRTGNFLPEVAHPYAELDRAGCGIDFACLTGDTPFLDALNLADDPDNLSFLVGNGWAKMQKAKKLADVDVSQYDAIFMPGGLAPMVDMPEHPLLKKVIKETFERKAVVGAVCHGPVSLLNVKLSDGNFLVAGKNISSFTNAEEDNYAKADVPFELETALVKQGAIFHKAAPWQAFSIADGNLVTGQNPASAKGVGEKMIELLAKLRSILVFVGVAALVCLVAGATAQEKGDTSDSQAKEVAEQFMKAMKAEDIDAIMKVAEVPFFWDGVKNIKDRDEVMKEFSRMFEKADLKRIEYEIKDVQSVAKWQEKQGEKDRELSKEVLDKDDRVVVVAVKAEIIAVMVRVRKGQANVAGFRD